MAEWVNILRQAGYPLNVIVIDFETHFSKTYSLSKLSTIEYIQDQRFEVLGIATLQMSGKQPYLDPTPHFWPDVENHLRYLRDKYGEHLEKCTVVAHNARFDVGVLTYRYNCRPPHVVDTLGLARHVAARKRNDLGRLCERYELIGKGDTSEFIGLHRDTLTEAQWRNLAAYAENDAAREFELFRILLPMLTRPAIELRLIAHTLTLFTRPLLTFDFNKADEIVAEMVEEEAKIIGASGYDRKAVSGTISFERLLRGVLGDEKPPTKKGKKKVILAVAATDPGREYLLNHEKPEVRSLMEAKVAIAIWPKNIKRVDRMVAQAKACGGYLAAPLKYYAAHTGRFGGDEKINLQNLSARSEYACINAIRGLLTAPPGHVLVITDAAQIEARVAAWVAGQDDLVEAFAAGQDVYCEFVSEILGSRIRKPRSGDPETVVKYLKHYRMLGKVGVLGATYGMGKDRCLVYAHDVYHIDIDKEMAGKIIDHYRKKNDRIVKFWADLDKAAIYVVRYPAEQCTLDRGITFRCEDDTLLLGLPSGRVLYYHDPAIGKNQWGYDQVQIPDERQKGNFISVYGGYLCENVCQAIARDILGDAILTLEDMGWPVALHAHDEIILVVPENLGKKALASSIEVLSQTPIWCAGMPLDAEGSITERYGKE